MDVEYIVVQAGGKGTRLEHLTKNKPKSLVPINNLPMIFHLFKKFKDKKFIIIGDYKIDVLKKYLSVFASVEYLVVDASQNKGTCAGIVDAIKLIPNHKGFMLIWSDLVLSDDFNFPRLNGNYIGLSKGFECRWKYENKLFEESPSKEYGVAGLFIFKDKSELNNVPLSGEFVKWLQQEKKQYDTLDLNGVNEYGLLSVYDNLGVSKCRPFNRITIKDNKLIKEGIDDQGKKLAIIEKDWYQFIKGKQFNNIPEIYSFEPFTMEKIDGDNIYNLNLSINDKKVVLESIVKCIKDLHSLGTVDVDYFDINETYLKKTFDRINKIRNLVPFANEKFITINGRKCRNVFFYQNELESKINSIVTNKFTVIHGDCTFSNMMVDKGLNPILIDPRGYFGKTQYYGDLKYDWAKIYYSLVGNYDQFNLKKFRLEIGEQDVKLSIESSGWEDMEDYFLNLIKDDISRDDIKLMHAIIWLSLTTYAWEDYDSICGAFYNGLYYLEEVL
ncbi:MAG: nucleoside-diphosphate-sugar pyrophosphorylase [Bacilli bacterium]|nr:nucleoside-diphosphate-sugar pyrophosphorylase [Bacilli bacterium]